MPSVIGTDYPYSEVLDYVYNDAGGFVRIATGVVEADNDISSFGSTKIDLTSVISNSPTYAGTASTEKKYFETKLGGGTTLRIENQAPTISAETGYKVAADAKSVEKFDITAMVEYSDFATLLAIFRAGGTVTAIRPMGKKASDGTQVGYEHIIGKLTEFTVTPKDGLQEIKMVITGGTVFTKSGTATYTAYNTLLTGAGNTIIPVGEETALTIKDITDGNLTTMLTGVILQTAAS